MPLPPEAVEALDDATAPERLAEIAERFPQLQSLVVANSACPPETRERILATNPAAAEVYAAAQGGAEADDAAASGPAASPDAAAADGAVTDGAAKDGSPGVQADAAPSAAADHPETEEDAWSILAPVLGDRAEDAATDGMDPIDDEPTQAMAPVAPEDEPTQAMAAVPDDGPTRIAPVDDDATRIAPVGATAADGAPDQSAGADAEDLSGDADAPTEALAPIDAPIAGAPAAAVAPAPGTTPDDVPPLPRVTGYLDSIPTAVADDEPVEAYGTIASPTGYGTAPSPAGYGTPTGYGTAPSPSGYGAPVAAGATAAAGAGYGPAASPSPYVAPADPSASDPSAPRRGRGGLAIAIGCLVAALLLALAVLGGWILLSRDDAPQAGPTPSAAESTAPEETASASASSSASPSSDALVKPAPADAQELNLVQSPSGNILCSLEDGAVGCTALESTPSGESCPGGASYTIAVADGEAALDCDAPRPAGGTKLSYGESAVSGDMACTSAKSGMTCWNQRTGHGFTVSKKEQTTF